MFLAVNIAASEDAVLEPVDMGVLCPPNPTLLCLHSFITYTAAGVEMR